MPKLEEIQDPETLKQTAILLEKTVLDQQKKIAKLQAELARLRGEDHPQLELELLKEQLEQLRRRVFAPSTEKRPHAAEAHPERAPQTGHGPKDQPALPTLVVDHTLADEERTCPACGGALVAMDGQFEQTEEVSVVEATYTVVTHRRQKYRCRCNGAVVTAPAPAKLIPGGRYAPEFAVHVAVAKYLDHLPLERQVRAMARSGLDVDSQTLWDQTYALAKALEPTCEALRARVLDAPVVFADETRWPVNARTDSTKGWWVWEVASEDTAVYWILPSRGEASAGTILGSYAGTVLCDGYSVYAAVARNGPRYRLAHCWAHVRRKFVEAEPSSALATEALELIGKLYLVERQLPPVDRHASPDTREAILAARRDLRAQRSKPVTDVLREWAYAVLPTVLPQSAIGKAITYMLNLWPGLTAFLDDPRIPLDNNAAERGLRGIVVGRKNHYGSRSQRGATVAATLYTLFETAKLAGVNPHAYVLAAVKKAIATPGAVTLPEELICVD